MRIITGFSGYKTESSNAIAIGTFDGVHLGHRTVIEKAVGGSFEPSVMTFQRPPANILRGGSPLITSESIKREIIKSLGIKNYFLPNFSDVRNLSPEEFADLLIVKLGAKKIICGFNFRFGKGASGNAEDLTRLANERGAKTIIVPPVSIDDVAISSTDIRKMIEQGEIDRANKCLGRPFSFDFEVSHGAHLGTDFMQVPTINQQWCDGFVVPKFGVYASKVNIGGDIYKSITNIGTTPSVQNNSLRAETHIFGFNGTLYGENPTVQLYSFLREEKKFANIDELKSQILSDSEKVKNAEY